MCPQPTKALASWQPPEAAKKRGRALPGSLGRKQGPADPLIPNVYPPHMWVNTVLLCSASRCVVIGLSGPGKPTQKCVCTLGWFSGSTCLLEYEVKPRSCATGGQPVLASPSWGQHWGGRGRKEDSRPLWWAAWAEERSRTVRDEQSPSALGVDSGARNARWEEPKDHVFFHLPRMGPWKANQTSPVFRFWASVGFGPAKIPWIRINSNFGIYTVPRVLLVGSLKGSINWSPCLEPLER